MKVSKFKVLLYLKKSNLDKQGKAPIMGRITLNNSMAQFSCKLSCNPKLWNSRSGRLEGKSKEAVETNVKIERILLEDTKNRVGIGNSAASRSLIHLSPFNNGR